MEKDENKLKTERVTGEKIIKQRSESETFQAIADVHSKRVSLFRQEQKSNDSGLRSNKELGEQTSSTRTCKSNSDHEVIRSKNPEQDYIQKDILPEIEKIGFSNLSHLDIENRDIFETGGTLLDRTTESYRERGRSLGLTEGSGSGSRKIPRHTNILTESEMKSEEASFCFLLEHWKISKDLCLKRYDIFCKNMRKWWKLSTCRNQLVKAPLYYVVALLICLICLILANGKMSTDDQIDIPICIIIVTLFCCVNSLSCKRGCFYDFMEYGVNQFFISSDLPDIYATNYIASLKRQCCCQCLLCCLVDADNDNLPPHILSYNNRRDKSMLNTAFEHEVVDVSNLDPGECPQILQFEYKDICDSASSEGKQVETAAAVVHFSEARTYSNEDGFTCEHSDQSAACGCAELHQNKKSVESASLHQAPTNEDIVTLDQQSGQDANSFELHLKRKCKGKSNITRNQENENVQKCIQDVHSTQLGLKGKSENIFPMFPRSGSSHTSEQQCDLKIDATEVILEEKSKNIFPIYPPSRCIEKSGKDDVQEIDPIDLVQTEKCESTFSKHPTSRNIYKSEHQYSQKVNISEMTQKVKSVSIFSKFPASKSIYKCEQQCDKENDPIKLFDPKEKSKPIFPTYPAGSYIDKSEKQDCQDVNPIDLACKKMLYKNIFPKHTTRESNLKIQDQYCQPVDCTEPSRTEKSKSVSAKHPTRENIFKSEQHCGQDPKLNDLSKIEELKSTLEKYLTRENLGPTEQFRQILGHTKSPRVIKSEMKKSLKNETVTYKKHYHQNVPYFKATPKFPLGHPTKEDNYFRVQRYRQNAPHPGNVPRPKRKSKFPPRRRSSDDEIFVCEHYGQDVACACPELARKGKLDTQNMVLPRNSPASDEEVFMCEHYGQSVACACAGLHRNKSGFGRGAFR